VGVRRTLLLAPLLVALPLLLSACSVQSLLPSATLVGSTPTPVPTALPTAPPVDQSSTTAFDNAAGNCVDAANQAITLTQQAAAGRFGNNSIFNMDMHLDLEPHGPNSGCADSPAHVARYRQYVSAATLTVWPLDSQWYYAGTAIRQQWLADMLGALQSLYARAHIDVNVIYNGTPCGSASIGFGKGGERQFNMSCG
jgi:hypothetical protein